MQGKHLTSAILGTPEIPLTKGTTPKNYPLRHPIIPIACPKFINCPPGILLPAQTLGGVPRQAQRASERLPPLGHQARQEPTPDAHTNHSPNPWQGQ